MARNSDENRDRQQIISDETSDDDASQIIALEEDRGIHHHSEVVYPPKYESDEGDEKMMDDDERASRMGRRRPYDQADDGNHTHLRSPSPESLSYIKALENPMAVRENDEEFEELVKGPKEPKHPLGSPPAYSSSDEKTLNEPEPKSNNVTEPKNLRGSLNELLITKVAQPFQKMIRRASRLEENSTSDDDDDDLNEEEIQVLSYIDAYKPVEIELRPQLRPFLLEYIPSIGDIDAFIKVPRPDDVDDNVGLTSLDEPAIQQSDATILNMQLRNASKEVSTSSAMDDPPVKLLQRADKNLDEIEKWIQNIKELHKSRPAQTVHYKGAMPDIDSLMQEWPAKLDEAFKTIQLPTSDLDVTLEEYVDICLNIFDIPVGKSRIQALHLMFSLLNEFNNSQHFRNLAQNNELHGETGETMDRLEL